MNQLFYYFFVTYQLFISLIHQFSQNSKTNFILILLLFIIVNNLLRMIDFIRLSLNFYRVGHMTLLNPWILKNLSMDIKT